MISVVARGWTSSSSLQFFLVDEHNCCSHDKLLINFRRRLLVDRDAENLISMDPVIFNNIQTLLLSLFFTL